MLINPLLTLPGLILLTLAPLAETYVSQQLKAANLRALQTSLRTLESVPNSSLCPSTKPQGLALLQGLTELRLLQETVHQQEQAILVREAAMKDTLP